MSLASDPGETTDLAAREPERAAALRDRLHRWQGDVGAVGTPTNREVDSLTQQYFDASMEAANVWGGVGQNFSVQVNRFATVIDRLEKSPLLMSKSDAKAVTASKPDMREPLPTSAE